MYLTAEGLRRQLPNNSVVPIDLREREKAEQGHIPSAVSIPASELPRLLNRLPEHTGAPLVLYDQTGNSDIVAAFHTFRKAGYTNISILQGGFTEWQEGGFRTLRGKIAQTIDYTRAEPEGVVDAKEFIRAATTRNPDTVILDVRSNEEVAKGIITGAVAIPADEVVDRLAELPSGKQILIYCKSGVRAAMVYSLLKDKAFSAKYLDKGVTIEKDGSFTVQDHSENL